MYVAGLGPQEHLGRHSENGPQMCRFGAYGGQFSGFWTPLGKWTPDAPFSCLARATAAECGVPENGPRMGAAAAEFWTLDVTLCHRPLDGLGTAVRLYYSRKHSGTDRTS